METFTKLFGSLLLFVYHCFDRVVINGYMSGLSRPGQVVHFFQNFVGDPVIGKEVLSRRTPRSASPCLSCPRSTRAMKCISPQMPAASHRAKPTTWW